MQSAFSGEDSLAFIEWYSEQHMLWWKGNVEMYWGGEGLRVEEGRREVTDVEERLEEIIRVGKYLVLVKILRKQAPCERSCWHGKATAGEKFEIPGGVRKQLPCAAHEEKLPLYVCVWGYGTSLPMNSINSFNSINIINHINYFKQTKTLQKKKSLRYRGWHLRWAFRFAL